MAMPKPQTEWTLEMVHALPDDGNRYELVDGELLVRPASSLLHQRVLAALFEILRPYVQAIGGHEALFAPAAITFSVRRELQPDLFVMPLLGALRAALCGRWSPAPRG
jgi:Uma2 family endonuclease